MATTLQIDFHGDPLLIIREERGDLVPLRPLVTGMGLNWSGQLQRVKRHPILGKAVCVTHTTASPAGDKDGVCLPLDKIPGFLFGVNTDRIDDSATQSKVLAYQEECFRVLARACFGAADPEREPPLEAPTTRVPAKLALRMVSEARHAFDAQAAREVWFATGLLVTPSMRETSAQGSLFTYTAERRGGQP